MTTKRLLIIIFRPIAILVTPIILVLLYAHGPIWILRLTPYEIEQKRTVFPQWIDNDEIAYLELVLHRDKTVFEGGKFIFFIKQPITDIYIYREKINQPKTKKLIKHIARRHIQPNQSLEGSLDSDMGFRVYNNGKNIFLYYNYYGNLTRDFRYVTMDINGGHIKERIPPIFPFDISQDGKKMYGIQEVIPTKMETNVSKGAIHFRINRTAEPVHFIVEYVMKTRKIRKIMDITDEKFQQTYRGLINDLKLISRDKLILAYTNDINEPDRFQYMYLIDLTDGKAEFVCDPSKAYFDDNMPYYENYIFDPNQGAVVTKDEKFLILGIDGAYKKEDSDWVKIKPFFYKEYPAISPDGAKIAFIDILSERGELNSLYFTGRKLTIMAFEDLFEHETSEAK